MRKREFECVLLMNRLTDKERLEMYSTFRLLAQAMEKEYEQSIEKFPDGYHGRKMREYLRMIEHGLGDIAANRAKEEDNKRPLEMWKE